MQLQSSICACGGSPEVLLHGMSSLGSEGTCGGCRYVTLGLGDVPLATGEGTTAQDMFLLCVLTLTCICSGEWTGVQSDLY